MNFDPVLFEANKVTFEHGKPLDISCFNEVATCHIMILMIGGRYGSIISEQNAENEKAIYDKEYISITRKEYETALQNNIPTFIFIDKNVYGEYNTYKINRDFYEQAVENLEFKFFHVDSINVFKFIDLVSTKALKTFERIEEIEEYLKDQISGMFYLYLESLKQNNRQDEIFDAVSELKSLTTAMNTVIKEVGKTIISPERYKEIIDEQFKIVVSFFVDKFYENVDYSGEQSIHKIDEDTVNQLVEYFLKNILTEKISEKIPPLTKASSIGDWMRGRQNVLAQLNEDLVAIIPGYTLNSNMFNFITRYLNKVKPLITSDEQEAHFNDALTEAIKYSDMPF